MDETTVQVLKEPGRTAQSTSYLWVQQSGERDHPVVLTLLPAAMTVADIEALLPCADSTAG